MTFSFSDFEEKSKQDQINREKSKALSDQKSNIVKKHGKDVQIFTKSRVRLEKGAELGVIILDRDIERVLRYKEHPVVPGGDFRETFYAGCFATDPGVGQNCPLCKASNRKANGVEQARFVLGLTVLVVDRKVVDGKTEFVPVPNYVSKGKAAYGKQLWAVFNATARQGLIDILKEVYADHKTIRGLYIPVTRPATEISAGHGALGTIKGKNGTAKTYHFLGAGAEAMIEKLAKQIQPSPIVNKEGKLLASELVPVHDFKWASEPLNCYEAMTDKLSLEEATKLFDPDYVEKLDESSTADDFFSDEEEEVSLDTGSDVEETVEAVAAPATTTRTAGGRGRKLNLTKPLVVEKEEDDFGDLGEDAEEEIEEEELQAPVTKKKKVVIEDDGFDEFDLE
jgi:hypothetical protein